MGRLNGARAERAQPLDQLARAAAGRKRGKTTSIDGKLLLLLVCLMPVAVSAQYSDGSNAGCEAGKITATTGSNDCTECKAGTYSTGDIVNKAWGCGDGRSPCSVSASSIDGDAYASSAVDGLTSNFFHTECNKANEWFMLDLKSEYEIASVKIFNREPFQSLSGAEIRVGNIDSFDGNPACVSNLPGESVITVTCRATGRYVFVVQPRSDTCLHFSEIEVPIRLGCIACPAGKLSVAVGASAAAACVDCGPGMFENATGSSACKTCGANADSLPGSPNERSCFCKAGFYGDGTSCQACQAGKYTYSHTAAFLTEKENPPEASRSYSSLVNGQWARSMLDSGAAWCAGRSTAGTEWIKIDLGLAMRVHGVVLQARHENNDYLTEVEVKHSLDPNSGFSSVQSHANGGVRFFPAATFSSNQLSRLHCQPEL